MLAWCPHVPDAVSWPAAEPSDVTLQLHSSFLMFWNSTSPKPAGRRCNVGSFLFSPSASNNLTTTHAHVQVGCVRACVCVRRIQEAGFCSVSGSWLGRSGLISTHPSYPINARVVFVVSGHRASLFLPRFDRRTRILLASRLWLTQSATAWPIVITAPKRCVHL